MVECVPKWISFPLSLYVHLKHFLVLPLPLMAYTWQPSGGNSLCRTHVASSQNKGCDCSTHLFTFCGHAPFTFLRLPNKTSNKSHNWQFQKCLSRFAGRVLDVERGLPQRNDARGGCRWKHAGQLTFRAGKGQ